jgi:LysR family transcriptional regulator, transcriptional activator of nhaA
MEWLNYHHLRYFWATAHEGSVTRASDRLHISQPTVSAQIRELEEALGEKLFTRSGRSLALTEFGQLVLQYADEVFSAGQELLNAVKDRPGARPVVLRVGIANVIPKWIAYRLIEPALRLPEAVRLVCLEDRFERLLAELAVHHLDVVLADAPCGPTIKVRAYNHLLGDCGVSIFGAVHLAKARRRGFPGSLEGAPMLMPREDSALRRSLDQWFEERGIRPRITGEFDDSALLKVFGQMGMGLCAVPSAIEKEVRRQDGMHLLGRIESVRAQFYAITVERRLKQPAVVAIAEAARHRLFA